MDLNSLVKAYTAILYQNNQTNVQPEMIKNESMENGLKRQHNGFEENDTIEPESKRRQTHGAFEPIFRPIVPPIFNFQPYRTMNSCCCDALQRYTAYVEKELMNELSRATRQTLINSLKFWQTIPIVHPQPRMPTTMISTPTTCSIQHLNTLTNRIGQTTNTCFSSIQSLANNDSPVKNEIEPKVEITNEITSRGASVRKRKCKVTDMMADSPPTKSLSLSNGCRVFSNHEYMSSGFNPSSTLTSAHLRKAKLLFLFSRYPSSVNIKDYFPDVRFNKANTAQLVKWFSNFREYFYIQVEKFARQFASDPSIHVDDIDIEKCSEVLKNLNIHYNRSNRVDIPKNFVDAVIVALKEFFLAVRNGTDTESSWKKAIYKIVTRLDVDIPANMKAPDY